MNDVTGSFIPKRSDQAQIRRPVKANFVLFSILSYALFIAAPVASAAIYVYKVYTEKQYTQAVEDLNAAVQSFSTTDLDRVVAFDKRLDAAATLLDARLAHSAILQVLENSTVDTVGFAALTLARGAGNQVVVNGELETTSFDSALFQSEVYDRDQLVDAFTITDLAYTPAVVEDAGAISAPARISFDAAFTFTDEVSTGTSIEAATDTSDAAAESTFDLELDAATGTAATGESMPAVEPAEAEVTPDTL